VASYLVENSIGNYRIRSRAVDGVRYYQVQDTAIPAAQQRKNLAVIDQQPQITAFEATFNGRFPFATDGVIVGTPTVSFAEEMQTMITFPGGRIDIDTLYHENMHQWWGDNVTESGYALTFYKEGLATLAEFFYAARKAAAAVGGIGTPAGRAAFEASLVHQFDTLYAQRDGFWTQAPSNPTPFGLFSGSATYDRPGAAYIAVRQILGHANFTQALRQIQRQYGGSSITEAQLEAAFARWLPNRSAACQHRLASFFSQWFDTAYLAGGGANRPHITGPGLAGPGFYDARGGCPAS
jgi:hypothetical protein